MWGEWLVRVSQWEYHDGGETRNKTEHRHMLCIHKSPLELSVSVTLEKKTLTWRRLG